MDTQVSKNTTSISTNTAAIGELKDLSNITATGKTAIKNLLDVVGDNDQVTVAPDDDPSTGKRTYTITVKKDGAIAADNDNRQTTRKAIRIRIRTLSRRLPLAIIPMQQIVLSLWVKVHRLKAMPVWHWGIVQRVPTLTVLLSAMLLVHQLAILLSVLVQLQRVLLQELANGRIQ
nr:hypothetical protein [Mitsuokella multacida]